MINPPLTASNRYLGSINIFFTHACNCQNRECIPNFLILLSITYDKDLANDVEQEKKYELLRKLNIKSSDDQQIYLIHIPKAI